MWQQEPLVIIWLTNCIQPVKVLFSLKYSMEELQKTMPTIAEEFKKHITKIPHCSRHQIGNICISCSAPNADLKILKKELCSNISMKY